MKSIKQIIDHLIETEKPKEVVEWVDLRRVSKRASISTVLNDLTLDEAQNVIKELFEKAAKELGVGVSDIRVQKDPSGYNTIFSKTRIETEEEYLARIESRARVMHRWNVDIKN